MSEFYGHFIGVMIVVMMLAFIGIWIWAWLPHHKKEFRRTGPDAAGRGRAMSGIWSVWVMVLACVTVGVSLLLFLWGMWMRIPTIADGTTGHVWAQRHVARGGAAPADVVGADLRCHIHFRRGLSIAVSGIRQLWRQARMELARRSSSADTAANNARLEARIAPWRTLDLEQLAADKDAVAIGHRLYLDNCAACHGREGLGNHAVGAPDLTDADWLWGGDAETILTSILDGRNGVMPPLESALGHNGVNDVAVYVVSRTGSAVPTGMDCGGQDSLRRSVQRLSRCGRPRQPSPRRAQSVRRRLALRSQHRECRGKRAQRTQRRYAAVASASIHG